MAVKQIKNSMVPNNYVVFNMNGRMGLNKVVNSKSEGKKLVPIMQPMFDCITPAKSLGRIMIASINRFSSIKGDARVTLTNHLKEVITNLNIYDIIFGKNVIYILTENKTHSGFEWGFIKSFDDSIKYEDVTFIGAYNFEDRQIGAINNMGNQYFRDAQENGTVRMTYLGAEVKNTDEYIITYQLDVSTGKISEYKVKRNASLADLAKGMDSSLRNITKGANKEGTAQENLYVNPNTVCVWQVEDDMFKVYDEKGKELIKTRVMIDMGAESNKAVFDKLIGGKSANFNIMESVSNLIKMFEAGTNFMLFGGLVYNLIEYCKADNNKVAGLVDHLTHGWEMDSKGEYGFKVYALGNLFFTLVRPKGKAIMITVNHAYKDKDAAYISALLDEKFGLEYITKPTDMSIIKLTGITVKSSAGHFTDFMSPCSVRARPVFVKDISKFEYRKLSVFSLAGTCQGIEEGFGCEVMMARDFAYISKDKKNGTSKNWIETNLDYVLEIDEEH